MEVIKLSLIQTRALRRNNSFADRLGISYVALEPKPEADVHPAPYPSRQTSKRSRDSREFTPAQNILWVKCGVGRFQEHRKHQLYQRFNAVLLVDLSGKRSNQIFDELANWEEVLKGSSLANPAPPAP